MGVVVIYLYLRLQTLSCCLSSERADAERRRDRTNTLTNWHLLLTDICFLSRHVFTDSSSSGSLAAIELIEPSEE
jgi:hypothetical protein